MRINVHELTRRGGHLGHSVTGRALDADAPLLHDQVLRAVAQLTTLASARQCQTGTGRLAPDSTERSTASSTRRNMLTSLTDSSSSPQPAADSGEIPFEPSLKLLSSTTDGSVSIASEEEVSDATATDFWQYGHSITHKLAGHFPTAGRASASAVCLAATAEPCMDR
ncbi:hypothetical protein ON010_g15012 [Phytophthora cinnamomi]|nr:hypothetical protein ON010_g15012 [Phytophthora cinnamomi]